MKLNPAETRGSASTHLPTRHQTRDALPHALRKNDLMIHGIQNTMQITIKNDRTMKMAERLRERLDQAGKLRCPKHDQSVVAVAIYGRENGWFDTRWTTCCEALEQQARAIVKDRL